MATVKVISKGGFLHGSNYHASGSTFNMPCEQVPLYQGILQRIDDECTDSIEPSNHETTKQVSNYSNKKLKSKKNKKCSAC